MVSGIGFDLRRNRGAVGLLWCASERSLVDDAWFAWGGHHAATKRGDLLYTLWVTEGGGVVVKDRWSPGILARNCLCVSDTTTPSRLYLLSVKHHRDVEVGTERAAKAGVYALQTEGNLSEGTIAARLKECHDITFVNRSLYRVMSICKRHPYGSRASRSSGLTIEGLHCFSWGPFPFDHGILIDDAGAAYPEVEFASLRL